MTVWLVQIGFVATARSRCGAALRRVPLAAEVLVKSLVMTAALLAVGLTLQAVLYAEPYRLRWLTRDWLSTELPRISRPEGLFSSCVRDSGGRRPRRPRTWFRAAEGSLNPRPFCCGLDFYRRLTPSKAFGFRRAGAF